jgi:hypothetical protein
VRTDKGKSIFSARNVDSMRASPAPVTE